MSAPVGSTPPAAASTWVMPMLVSSSGYSPGRVTWPSTDTWRLRSAASATLTCGSLRNLPFFSASAICLPASAVDLPAIFCSPISGTDTVPFSEMRASVVMSGCWNTVTRTASPTPSLSLCAHAAPAANSTANRMALIITSSCRITWC